MFNLYSEAFTWLTVILMRKMLGFWDLAFLAETRVSNYPQVGSQKMHFDCQFLGVLIYIPNLNYILKNIEEAHRKRHT